jgi:hypothetical protein
VSIVVNNIVCDTDAEALEQIRRLVWRLAPSHRDPERFHEDKSEINAALNKLLRLVARQPVRLRAHINGAAVTAVGRGKASALVPSRGCFPRPCGSACAPGKGQWRPIETATPDQASLPAAATYIRTG